MALARFHRRGRDAAWPRKALLGKQRVMCPPKWRGDPGSTPMSGQRERIALVGCHCNHEACERRAVCESTVCRGSSNGCLGPLVHQGATRRAAQPKAAALARDGLHTASGAPRQVVNEAIAPSPRTGTTINTIIC